MSGPVTARAVELEELIRSTGVRATVDVRNAVPPCVLVVPVPRRNYGTLSGGFEVTWQLVALAPAPGDLVAAEALEELVDAVAGVVAIETAEPTSYVVPGAEAAVPAYIITTTEHATEA